MVHFSDLVPPPPPNFGHATPLPYNTVRTPSARVYKRKNIFKSVPKGRVDRQVETISPIKPRITKS